MKLYKMRGEDAIESPSGDWVHYEDHQDELDTERARWQALNDACLALKGEREKLREALDDLVRVIELEPDIGMLGEFKNVERLLAELLATPEVSGGLNYCGRLNEPGSVCEFPKGHSGPCDFEDTRFDWEKERGIP